MARYRIVIAADGVDIPQEDVRGFFTTRFVRASSAEDAKEQALRLVREAIAAEPVFAASPKPALSVEIANRVWSPLKSSMPNAGYSFFATDEGRDDALEIERAAGDGWW